MYNRNDGELPRKADVSTLTKIAANGGKLGGYFFCAKITMTKIFARAISIVVNANKLSYVTYIGNHLLSMESREIPRPMKKSGNNPPTAYL